MIVSYCATVPIMEEFPKSLLNVMKGTPLCPYIFNKPLRYSRDVKNAHHWTTEYVWKNVIPKITSDLHLNFNPSDYNFITNKTVVGDYSHHDYKGPVNCTYTDHEANQTLTGGYDVIRMNSNEPCWSDYHRLYRGAHRVSSLQNHAINSDRCLLIVGDSMTVPIIPILYNYFRKVIVLDARSNKVINNLIQWNEITDMLYCFTTHGWVVKKLWKAYLSPYLKRK